MEYINDFKKKQNFDKRVAESFKLNSKYPDRAPIIVDRSEKNGPEINCHKFLVPKDLTLAGFTQVLRSRINMRPSEALFLFVGKGTLAQSNARIADLYQRHSDLDGFLYIHYTLENTFG